MTAPVRMFFRSAFLFSFLFIAGPVFAQMGEGWNELKGTHFIIYHQAPNAVFSARVMKKAEQFYNQVAGDLGYSRRGKFWLWENRAKIYLYSSRENFLSSSGLATGWSNGFAIPERRTIVSFEGSDVFLESILPHELAHLIFRDFVGIDNGTVPLWLDEGLAMSEERNRRAGFDQMVRQMIAQRAWIPVAQLNNIRSLQGYSKPQAAVFYAESQSLVRFLLNKGGAPERFIQFCRDLRDGKSLDEAFSSNYQRKFPSVQQFEAAWVQANA